MQSRFVRLGRNEYYATEQRAGDCPPGLAKKNNGCMPPGQAKKWHKGRHLPRDVVFHNLPSRLEEQLGAPPSGHRFVRVASDISLLAVGTGMVVDAMCVLPPRQGIRLPVSCAEACASTLQQHWTHVLMARWTCPTHQQGNPRAANRYRSWRQSIAHSFATARASAIPEQCQTGGVAIRRYPGGLR